MIPVGGTKQRNTPICNPGDYHGKTHENSQTSSHIQDSVFIGNTQTKNTKPEFNPLTIKSYHPEKKAPHSLTAEQIQNQAHEEISVCIDLAAPSNGPLAASIKTLGNITNTQNKEPLPDFLFAKKYTIEEIMNNPASAEAFENEYLLRESEYFPLARHPESGLTYDGINLDIKTGTPGEPRAWSAPSKECLDIALLLKALQKDPKASLVVAKGDTQQAQTTAARILDQKIESYQAFNREHPEYKGFLPWFSSGEKIEPAWNGLIPGLDNGQWLWTLAVAENVLREQGHTETADKYSQYVDMMRKNVVEVFYDDKAGKIRGNVRMEPVRKGKNPPFIPPMRQTIREGDYITGEHGIHEGQMMILFATLLGEGLPENASERIWKDINMERVEHKHGTTWKAFWGSAHESWSYLFLPYREIQEYKDLYRIREVIRTQYAAENQYPGFGTSTNDPESTGYLDGSGIEGIGSQPVPNNHVFAVYGCFPLLHLNADKTENTGNYGLAWLQNMLTAPKMQGPVGGGESETNDGTKYSPMKTIDGTFLNLLALMGGIEHETADTLKKYGKYEDFINIMKTKYTEAFNSTPLREPAGFALPTKSVPNTQLPEYNPEIRNQKSEV